MLYRGSIVFGHCEAIYITSGLVSSRIVGKQSHLVCLSLQEALQDTLATPQQACSKSSLTPDFQHGFLSQDALDCTRAQPYNKKAKSIPIFNPINKYGRVFFFSYLGFFIAFWSW